ncbi:hypothetical protein BC835DRAFT_1422514 [Cytidiella melzeri]|nr:hypothetical protein BC835DRAFT_1422514 [Cytidiella melzeri]
MMKTSTVLSLLAFASNAHAQNATALAGLAAAFESMGLTSLVSVASTINGTSTGNTLLSNLTSGAPYVVFAPNNDAWSKAPTNVTNNTSILADVFSYHLVPGNFSGDATVYPNVTLGRTLYNDPATVRLEGGKSQVVAWSIRADNKTHVLNQRNDSTVVNVTTFGNLTIFIVDHVLNVPESLDATIPADNASLTGFETLLHSTVATDVFNSSTNQTNNVSWYDAINTGFHGFTLFAPNNSAVSNVNSSLSTLNSTELTDVVENLFINGTTLYSPLLAGSSNYTSAAGESLSFSINATGTYITSGNFSARIIQPDVLLPNGVIHIIDTFLINTANDSSAASSAISSAASAATQTSSQTAAIGFSATQSLGGASGVPSPSGSGSGSSSAALSLTDAAAGKELAVAVAGAVLGALMTVF